ncbi:ATP-binding protein [Streptomyces sp. WSLK1-5]
MSHLRAPAARADRREGGRHGRPVARPTRSLPETHIRPQLLRLAVLPPVAVALSGCAAVLFTVRSTGAHPGLILWSVLAGAVSVALAGILIAAVAADRAAKTVSDRVGALRRSSARREADLRALVEGLRRGEAPPGRTPRGGPPDGADDFELLAADLTRAHDGAVTAVVAAAQLSSQAGSEQKLEVFVNLARRLQSLVHREIAILDELENEIEDPDLLKGLFHVDHLATRIRRHAENLAVLGGAVSRRQWSNPVSMTEVLRSAIAEVEQYSRVKLVPPIDGTLRGHAVADVIHLLAELVENATVFSAPHTQVLLRANLVTSGLAVEVEDRGLGMPVAEQHRMNALLSDPDQVNVASLLADGRIGLFVVSQLAKRHGIHVRLQTNIYGGVQAVLVVPQALLGSEPGALGAQPPEAVGAGGGAGTVVPARPRSGHEARHRGPEGSGAPTETSGTTVPQGVRRGNGRAPGLNGSGRAPSGRTPGSGGRGPVGDSAADGGGAVSSGGGRGPGDGRFLNGGSAVPGGGGSVSNAGGRLPGEVGPGGASRDGDRRALGGGGHVPGGGSLPSSDRALPRGDGRVLNSDGQLPGGAGALSSGGGDALGGGGRVPGGGSLSSGAGAVPSGDGGDALGGGGVLSHGGGTATSQGGGAFPLGGGVPDGGGQVGGGEARPDGSDFLNVGPGGGSPVPGGDVLSLGGGASLAGDSAAPGGGGSGHPAGGNGSLAGGKGTVADRHPDDGGGARSGRPAPLPVRGARGSRPTPADAVPGIRPDDRRLVAEHVAAPPTPRTGTVRGTMGKPQLPRRRAQEHIAPQLRGGPAPRQDAATPAGHDPGLMAAFQRGISLAEAQQHLEPEDGESATSLPLPLPSPRMEADLESRTAPSPRPSPHPSASFDFGPDPDPGASHTGAAPTTDAAAMDVTPMERPHISEAHGLDHDRTTPRHDGSAPAG